MVVLGPWLPLQSVPCTNCNPKAHCSSSSQQAFDIASTADCTARRCSGEAAAIPAHVFVSCLEHKTGNCSLTLLLFARADENLRAMRRFDAQVPRFRLIGDGRWQAPPVTEEESNSDFGGWESE